jgi:hypothetical protein
MRRHFIAVAVCLLAVSACTQPAPPGSLQEEYERGIGRGYELALEDVSDCAEADGGLEEFEECLEIQATGIAMEFLDATEAELRARGNAAASEASDIWFGMLSRIGS